MNRKRLLLLGLLAACADRGLSDEMSARDSVAPRLDVRTPLRGSIAPGTGAIEVRGVVSDADSAIAKVTVNNQPATPGSDGAFKVSVPSVQGLTLIHTVVEDVQGNKTSDTRAVLTGNLVPVASTVKDGYVVHLDKTMIQVGGQLAAKGLTALDLTGVMTDLNPLVNIPVPCLGARVDVTRMRKGAVKVNLLPTEGGLTIDAEIADIDVAARVSYDVGCKKGTAEAGVQAAKFHIYGRLGVTLGGDGKLIIDTTDTTASFDGFHLDTSFLPSDVTDFIETPIGDTLAGVIADQVQKQIPPLVTKLVGKDQTASVEGQYLHIGFAPKSVAFDENGADITVDSRLYLQGSPGAVFLSSPEARPTFAGMPNKSLRVAIADDSVNQMLSSIWSSGIFDQTFKVDAGSYAGLGVLFDRVELAMRLPPVITALPNGAGVRVTIGDVECHFIRARPGEPVTTVTRLSLSAETTVNVTVKDNKLSMTAGEPVVWLDVLSDGVTGHNPFNDSSIQELGTFVAKNLLSFTGGLVSNIPLPTLEGMSITDAKVSTGDAPGYVVVSGSVSISQ